MRSTRKPPPLSSETPHDHATKIPRKLYEQIPDARAGEDGYVRVVDESGEDYLYPADYFVAVDLPREAERALAGGTLSTRGHS